MKSKATDNLFVEQAKELITIMEIKGRSVSSAMNIALTENLFTYFHDTEDRYRAIQERIILLRETLSKYKISMVMMLRWKLNNYVHTVLADIVDSNRRLELIYGIAYGQAHMWLLDTSTGTRLDFFKCMVHSMDNIHTMQDQERYDPIIGKKQAQYYIPVHEVRDSLFQQPK